MKALTTTLLLLTIFFQVKATHLAGGEISYSYLSGLDYKIKLRLLRDCSGGISPTIETVKLSSVNASQSINLTVSLISSGIINTYCNSVVTTCTNLSSGAPGFEYFDYEATVTLPMAASDWIFSYNHCCRNGNINNLFNPSSQGAYIYTTLNNLNSPGGFNNSAYFVLDNSVVFGINQTYSFSQSAIDVDGDSLHYSLVSAMDGSSNAPAVIGANYYAAAGYSPATPFASAGSIGINGSNGNITFSNSIISSNVVAIKVDEYRNGALIASTMKDMLFMFYNSGTNHLPSISGVNGGSNYYTSLNVCPNSSLTFNIDGSDVDVMDSTHVHVVATDIVGYNVTSNNALQETITFNWTPSTADIRSQPYVLIVEAKDNNCAKVSNGYLIYINQCNTDSVWAGDANADFVVNNYDVLNIGIGNGSSGAIRPSATTNWVAEYTPNWSVNFINGINYKHSDCNGDGIINSNDLSAVTSNYGQFHLKKENMGTFKRRGLPDLYVDVTGLSAIVGTTIQVPIMLGTTNSPMNNIYGIAGHLKVSNNLSADITLSNPISWLGNATNSILFQKNINSNDLAFTMVRSDQNNVSGAGQIGILSIPISTTAIMNSDLVIYFSDLQLIKNDGSVITDFNAWSDTLQITGPSLLPNNASLNTVQIFPNPVHDFLHIRLNKAEHEKIFFEIKDVLGNLVLCYQIPSNATNEYKINTSSLKKGYYILDVKTATNTYVQKLIK